MSESRDAGSALAAYQTHRTSSGVITNMPPDGQHVVVYDVLITSAVGGDVILREEGGGSTVFQMGVVAGVGIQVTPRVPLRSFNASVRLELVLPGAGRVVLSYGFVYPSLILTPELMA